MNTAVKMLSEIDLAKELLKINAIQLKPNEPFTWASGLKSPIYCDNRISLSYPELRSRIKKTLSSLCAEAWDFDLVAGVATAGIAHGALVAEELNLPFIYVRSSPKKHGAKNQIEGRYNQGQRCLVIEDLISTGGSSIAAVEVLREEGIEVVGVGALFSYEFAKAQLNFEQASCPFITISNYSALLKAAEEIGSIDKHQLTSLTSWRTDPQAWSNHKSDS